MKRIALFLSVGAIVMLLASGAMAGDKVTVCHKGKKTLSIGAAAVPAHLAHGDSLGPCNGGPPPPECAVDEDCANDTLCDTDLCVEGECQHLELGCPIHLCHLSNTCNPETGDCEEVLKDCGDGECDLETGECVLPSCPCFDAGNEPGGIDFQAETLEFPDCTTIDAPAALFVGFRGPPDAGVNGWGAVTTPLVPDCEFLDEANGIAVRVEPITEGENADCLRTILESEMWALNCPQ